MTTPPFPTTGCDGSRTGRPTDRGMGACGPDETILLPVGPSDHRRSDRLAHVAAETAGMMQTTIAVLHVITPERLQRARADLADDAPTPSEVDAVVRRLSPVADVVATLETPLANWGTTMTVEGRVSDAVAHEVVVAAEAYEAKRIIVGGRRRTPAGKVAFGSTAQEIMLDAPCPVTFVRDIDPL